MGDASERIDKKKKKLAIWQLDCELDDLTAGSATDDTNQKNLRGPRSASESLHYIHLFLAHHNSLAALRRHGAEQLDLVATQFLFFSRLGTPPFQKVFLRS